MNEWVKFFLGGGVLLSIVEGVKALISWGIRRKAQKEDHAEEKAEKKTEERITVMEGRIQILENNFKSLRPGLKIAGKWQKEEGRFSPVPLRILRRHRPRCTP